MKRFAIGFLLTWGVFASAGRMARVEGAADDPPEDSRTQPQEESSFRFQELDDPLPRLKSSRPRVPGDEARLDALAWFGSARVLQARNDLSGALRAYKKAIDSDPTALFVYRLAIPLAVELRQIELAAAWAAKAVELDPNDHQLLMQAAQLLISREDLPGAIALLEQAAKSPQLDKQTPFYVELMRDLAILYLAAGRKEDAAVGLEVVFDALNQPQKFKLDSRMRSLLQSNPATSYERMGQVFLEVKKTDLALAAFQKAAESKKGPAAGNLSFHLAQVHVQAEQFEKALAELQKYIDSQRQTKGRAAYELLVEILEKMHKSQEIVPRLETAAAKDTRNSTLQYFLAEQYAQAGRLADAEALFKKTLSSAAEAQGYVGLAGVYRRMAKPSDLLEMLGKAYQEAGELKGLAAEFKAIIGDDKLLDSVLEAGVKRIADAPPRLDFPTGYVLANLAADGKRSDTAQRLYRYLLEHRPDKSEMLYEELGQHLVDVKNYREAAKVFREAIDHQAEEGARAKLLYLLTIALELSGQTREALEAIAQAQELIPNNPALRSQEAWVYYHSHQFDEALERYERVIADFPQARDILRRAQYSISNIHVLRGNVPKGMEILEAIYRENPNDVSVNNDLGYLYADNNLHLEQAEQMIRKALEAEPENAAYLDSMGWVLFKLGKGGEALPYLEKAVKISTATGDETLFDHLGDVYASLGQTTQAVEAWTKALEMARQAPYPDQKLIDRVEEKLKNQKSDPGKLKPARP
ncbi:MAG: tetratricopeptide repeat protein [Planctomycetales bacterium]